MGYHERERQKAEAWPIVRDVEAPLPRRAWALLQVIDAHYQRAFEGLESLPKVQQRQIHGKRYTPGYQLDIDVYTRHWLYANGDAVSPEVVDAVREIYHYEPEQSKFLPKGQTSYSTYLCDKESARRER